jgi:hypothetical protein
MHDDLPCVSTLVSMRDAPIPASPDRPRRMIIAVDDDK